MTLIKKYQPTISNVWDNIFNDSFFNAADSRSSVTMPAVNISESEHAFSVQMASPGLEKKDFKISIEDGLLIVSAQQETKVEETKFSRKEFNYSSFKRSFTLPENINEEAISAEYINGVLKIDLPKIEIEEKDKTRAIEIK